MICLDTNYLIRSLVPGSAEASRMMSWTQAGQKLVAPAIVWFEFLCGPVTQSQIEIMRVFLSDVVAFGEQQAAESARLFNAVGRNRRMRVDVMIAGTAIALGVPLATENLADFSSFVQHGLHLVE